MEINYMNKHAYWAWAIKNSTVMICFTVLTLTFNKWWIVLFAMFFLSDLRTTPTTAYYRVCDICGEHSPYAKSPEEALKKAEEAGWIHYKGLNTDYCPKCKNERK
jgi:hypothetical protein